GKIVQGNLCRSPYLVDQVDGLLRGTVQFIQRFSAGQQDIGIPEQGEIVACIIAGAIGIFRIFKAAFVILPENDILVLLVHIGKQDSSQPLVVGVERINKARKQSEVGGEDHMRRI